MVFRRTHRIAERLNRTCFCVGVDVAALRRQLEDDLAPYGIAGKLIATHPHLFSAAPVFVARAQVEGMKRVIDAIHMAAGLPGYRSAVMADAPAISRSAPGPLGAFLGFDFHLTESGPQLIEINTNAGGGMINAALRRTQRACCTEVRRLARYQGDAGKLEETFFRMFLDEWRAARGEAPLARIAIVDDAPESQYLYPEFLMFRHLFEARGISAVIAAPEALHYHDGAIWCAGRGVDLVYNRLTDFYLEYPTHALLARAYADGAAVLTPHPWSHALFGNKRNLALLSDSERMRAIGAAEECIRALVDGIPRTEIVLAADGDRWWRERKGWFFKPARGFGSRGAYRGDKLTRGAFADIMRGDYVAQRIVPPGERLTAVGPEGQSLKIDLRCYVYAGSIQAIAARLYQGQTTNFRTPGGGFAPVYVI